MLPRDKYQEAYLKKRNMDGLSEYTINSYRKTFNSLNKFLKSNNISINYSEDNLLEILQDYFISISNLRAGYNVNKKRLKTFFNYLLAEEVVEYNPITKLKIKNKKENARPRPAKQESILKILSIIDKNSFAGFRDYTWITLTIDTGIRPQESIRLERVNFEGNYIFINEDIGKCQKPRILPLSPIIVKNLNKLLEINDRFPIKCNKIFLMETGKEIKNSVTFRNRLRFYCNKLGLENNDRVTPYQLRHYFASKYLENGGNIIYLQELMGHSDLDMTKRYLQLNQDAINKEHSTFTPLSGVVANNKLRKL